jgi:hypothetical protein
MLKPEIDTEMQKTQQNNQQTPAITDKRLVNGTSGGAMVVSEQGKYTGNYTDNRTLNKIETKTADIELEKNKVPHTLPTFAMLDGHQSEQAEEDVEKQQVIIAPKPKNSNILCEWVNTMWIGLKGTAEPKAKSLATWRGWIGALKYLVSLGTIPWVLVANDETEPVTKNQHFAETAIELVTKATVNLIDAFDTDMSKCETILGALLDLIDAVGTQLQVYPVTEAERAEVYADENATISQSQLWVRYEYSDIADGEAGIGDIMDGEWPLEAEFNQMYTPVLNPEWKMFGPANDLRNPKVMRLEPTEDVKGELAAEEPYGLKTFEYEQVTNYVDGEVANVNDEITYRDEIGERVTKMNMDEYENPDQVYKYYTNGGGILKGVILVLGLSKVYARGKKLQDDQRAKIYEQMPEDQQADKTLTVTTGIAKDGNCLYTSLQQMVGWVSPKAARKSFFNQNPNDNKTPNQALQDFIEMKYIATNTKERKELIDTLRSASGWTVQGDNAAEFVIKQCAKEMQVDIYYVQKIGGALVKVKYDGKIEFPELDYLTGSYTGDVLIRDDKQNHWEYGKLE